MFSSTVAALIKPFKTVIYAPTFEARLFLLFQPFHDHCYKTFMDVSDYCYGLSL